MRQAGGRALDLLEARARGSMSPLTQLSMPRLTGHSRSATKQPASDALRSIRQCVGYGLLQLLARKDLAGRKLDHSHGLRRVVHSSYVCFRPVKHERPCVAADGQVGLVSAHVGGLI